MISPAVLNVYVPLQIGGSTLRIDYSTLKPLVIFDYFFHTCFKYLRGMDILLSVLEAA